jgi:beta-fructofuranosidase
MLNPDDRWIWDFWHARDGDVHHLFYLQAPKALGEPELRHRNATVGHATSSDLHTWTEHGTVLSPGGTGEIDETATWTGSVVRADDGDWRMFYTGATFQEHGNSQVIAAATSADLFTWTKDLSFALRPDARWYERRGDSDWSEDAWRDPWVYRDQSNGIWHMLITARVESPDLADGGVIGHATSTNLLDWSVQPPLTAAGAGFGHLEVLQRVTLDDHDFVLFSATASVMSDRRRHDGATDGVWAAPIHADRIHLDNARNITGPELYSGRIIQSDTGPVLLAVRYLDETGAFLGGVCDPVPVLLTEKGITLARTRR